MMLLSLLSLFATAVNFSLIGFGIANNMKQNGQIKEKRNLFLIGLDEDNLYA